MSVCSPTPIDGRCYLREREKERCPSLPRASSFSYLDTLEDWERDSKEGTLQRFAEQGVRDRAGEKKKRRKWPPDAKI